MLAPDDRAHLMAALRPPEAYALDFAVGTTFSLDLLALLTLPLSFTFFQLETEDPQNQHDPLLLLEALRQYAGRLSIFCQAGQIAIPTASQLLYSYLEPSVVEVTARSRHGVFHPKVWALRYKPQDETSNLPTRYRLLCLSRNLTFDRSWDTMLVLDGHVTARVNAFGENYPLGAFFEALPELATRPVSHELRRRIETLTYELQRTRFEIPQPFKSVSFHPFGIKQGNRWPFDIRKDRALVISPFVTIQFLREMARGCDELTLVSRLDTLSQMTPDELSPCHRLFVLDPAAETAVESEAQEDNLTAVSEFNTPLDGLHAKLYLLEQGWQTELWTGSANATTAAFHHNVEFMVRLRGSRSTIGIDQLLKQTKDQTTLHDLLQPYKPGEPIVPEDQAVAKLEEAAGRLGRQLAALPLKATAIRSEGENEDLYRLSLFLSDDASPVSLPPDAGIICWPISLSQSAGVPVHEIKETLAQFTLSLAAVTTFFAIELTLREGADVGRARFVVNAPLTEEPDGRRRHIMRQLIGDKEKMSRYLLLLLAGEEGAPSLVQKLLAGSMTNGTASSVNDAHSAFFEPLVRALARHPETLDRIDRVLRDLDADESDTKLLPNNFLAIWKPIWEARQRLSKDEPT